MREDSTGMALALTRRYHDGYLAANNYQGGSVDTVLCRHCGTTVHHLAATCRNCGGKL